MQPWFQADGLADIALYASGIGPSKSMVISRDSLGRLDADTGLVAAAHAAGLAVHPWTFRRENYFLPTDLKGGINPAGTGYLEEEIQRFIAVGVDGLFSDNVSEAVTAREIRQVPNNISARLRRRSAATGPSADCADKEWRAGEIIARIIGPGREISRSS